MKKVAGIVLIALTSLAAIAFVAKPRKKSYAVFEAGRSRSLC